MMLTRLIVWVREWVSKLLVKPDKTVKSGWFKVPWRIE